VTEIKVFESYQTIKGFKVVLLTKTKEPPNAFGDFNTMRILLLPHNYQPVVYNPIAVADS
jgi:hypothetical protein